MSCSVGKIKNGNCFVALALQQWALDGRGLITLWGGHATAKSRDFIAGGYHRYRYTY
jgi:hypothetical protein